MIFIPVIIVFLLGIAFTPTSKPRGRRGRKSKSFLTRVFEGQARTQKRHAHNYGVMASSRTVGARGGKRRR